MISIVFWQGKRLRRMGIREGERVGKMCRETLLSILPIFQKVIVGIAKLVVGISTPNKATTLVATRNDEI